MMLLLLLLLLLLRETSTPIPTTTAPTTIVYRCRNVTVCCFENVLDHEKHDNPRHHRHYHRHILVQSLLAQASACYSISLSPVAAACMCIIISTYISKHIDIGAIFCQHSDDTGYVSTPKSPVKAPSRTFITNCI